MTDRIIAWLDAGSIIQFGISQFLQKNHDCELYALIDTTNSVRRFFEKQKMVNFKEKWFFHDHIKKGSKSDRDYLDSFEKKYGVNLWQLALNDRTLNHHNEFYNFTSDEVLSILTQECKLFEKILTKTKPDFFLTQETVFQPQHLFHLMCKSLGIKVLMLNHANFEKLCYVAEERHELDYVHNLDDIKGEDRSFEKLLNRLYAADFSKQISDFYYSDRNLVSKKFKSAYDYFIASSNTNLKTHYSYYGRTKTRVFFNYLFAKWKKQRRESFINSSFVKNPDYERRFIYVPLHQEPERSLLIAAPFFTNQVETIRHIAKSIPANFLLYVKEHPTQGPARDWRPISIYKEIMNIPNVVLIHPKVDSKKLLEKCAIVISTGGTSCFEAAFYQKPSITLTKMGYGLLPCIETVTSITELSDAITRSLEKKVKASDLDKYISLLEKNSFEFDYLQFEVKLLNTFFHGGNQVEIEIPIHEMEYFLNQEKEVFELLGREHLKKIKQHKVFLK